MATTKEKAIVFVYFTCLFESVRGYYCDNDKCLEEEFCCGENICCVSYKVWELWYFWCGILFCLFLLSMCACFWRQRQRAYWVFHSPTPYRPLNPEDKSSYNPVHGDPYNTKDRSLSPTFYSPSSTQPSWYAPHPAGNTPTQPYTDTEQLYDTGHGRKPDY
ncbi:WW domain binding protein VOPP1-like [Ruditapes philippinarum]|uniref:WW domain binding protein VOPP1-like n=1 Tax=Ruditapes philippinarum TaxID=129788 RepID=UPI00295C14A5|nr:WW domain binding protein VOPP1-like [Ruditapes philippinarum]